MFEGRNELCEALCSVVCRLQQNKELVAIAKSLLRRFSIMQFQNLKYKEAKTIGYW